MAKKKLPEYTFHTCGECARGEWSANPHNYDLNGMPFLKECEHSRWAINKRGVHVCLTSTQACEHFELIF